MHVRDCRFCVGFVDVENVGSPAIRAVCEAVTEVRISLRNEIGGAATEQVAYTAGSKERPYHGSRHIGRTSLASDPP